MVEQPSTSQVIVGAGHLVRLHPCKLRNDVLIGGLDPHDTPPGAEHGLGRADG